MSTHIGIKPEREPRKPAPAEMKPEPAEDKPKPKRTRKTTAKK